MEDYVVKDTLSPAWEGNFNYLPLDANGLTIIPEPSATSRIIYVSADGNDATAVNYAIGDVDNWRNPTGTINAYSTVATARSQMRSNESDYLLFKRGDNFAVSGTIEPPLGKSLAQRHVISWFGNSQLSLPSLNATSITLTTLRVQANSAVRGNVIIQGLNIPNPLRDPNHADFVGWANLDGTNSAVSFRSFGSTASTVSGIILEGCRIVYGGFHNVFIQELSDSVMYDLIIRNNFIGYSHSTTSHSMGIGGTSGKYIIENNAVVKNGYSDAAGSTTPATIFNHNMYLTLTNQSIVRNNISIAPSSIHQKYTANIPAGTGNVVKSQDVAIYGNINFRGGVVFSIGGNNSDNDGARWANYQIKRNIAQFIGNPPIAQNIAWGIDLQEHRNSEVSGNLLLEIDRPATTNRWWLKATGHQENTVYVDNIVRDFGGINAQSTSPGPATYSPNLVDADPSLFVDSDRTIGGYLTANSLGDSVEDLISVLDSDYVYNTYPALKPQAISEWYFEGFAIVSDEPPPVVDPEPPVIAEPELEPEPEVMPVVEPEPDPVNKSQLYGLMTRIENLLNTEDPRAAFSTAASMMRDKAELLERVGIMRQLISEAE